MVWCLTLRSRSHAQIREEKVGGVLRDTIDLFNGGNKDALIYGYGGSQAVPARPSGKGNEEKVWRSEVEKVER
jgi:hypothetical protein